MVHMVVVIDRQKNFAIHPVSVVPDIFSRGFWQTRELFRRVDPVKVFDKPPDLRAFADKFGGKDTQSVDRAFVEIGLDQEHWTTSRGQPRIS
jgi:hypothetical protein